MQDESPYAGLVTRGLAFVLDSLTINLSLLAVGSAARLVFDALDIFQSVDVGHILVGGLAWICLWGLYLTAFWALRGQTPGMWWMRTRSNASTARRSGGAQPRCERSEPDWRCCRSFSVSCQSC